MFFVHKSVRIAKNIVFGSRKRDFEEDCKDSNKNKRCNTHPTGATGRKALVYINNKIRMSVCLFVCLSVWLTTPPREMHEYGYIIYHSKQNLPGQDYIVIRNPSEQPFGRYWPESGRNSEKTTKNGLFFEVFGLFNTLSYMISTRNFKRW